MKSPFPGMDPYLEAELWPEVHLELISKIKKLLIPLLGQKYIARIERYVVKDTEPQEDLGIMYPDVEIFEDHIAEPATAYGKQKIPTPPTLTVSRYKPVEVRISLIKIRDKKNNKLVTALEILSPVNKRNSNYQAYMKKKQDLIDNGVHFLELDFIRRGKRTVINKKLPDCFYLVALTRAKSYQTDVWTIISLDTALPVIPVPLLPPDEDVLIDLQQALSEIYHESLFHRSIDYSEKPPPPILSELVYKKYTDVWNKS